MLFRSIGPIIGLLGGTVGVGGLFNAFRSKQDATAKAAEADAQAAKAAEAQAAYEKTLADARSIVAAIDAAKKENPQLQAELSKSKATILETITDGGHALVESRGIVTL